MKKLYLILVVFLATGLWLNVSAQAYLIVDPSVQTITPDGGSGFIGSVTSNVTWAATTGDAWITIIAPGTGSNNGNFSYNVGVNGDNARTGTITVSATDGSGVPDQTITIVQSGQYDYYMNLDPNAQNVVPNGGSGFIGSVTSNVTWAATTGDAWITIIAPGTGSNNGNFSYNVGVNGNDARTGTITLSATDGSGVDDKTITVSQAGQNDYYMNLEPTAQSVPSEGGVGYVSNVFSNVDWAVSADQTWITIIPPVTGSNDGTFTYDVDGNDGVARTSTITLIATDTSGVDNKTIIVYQEGSTDYYMNLDPNVQNVEPDGGSGFIGTVTSNVTWAATTGDAWITIIAPGTGLNNGNFSYNVGVNGNDARTGTITLSATDSSNVDDKTITISQAGQNDYYMNLDPHVQSVEPDGGSGFIGTVTSNVTWEVSTTADWISLIAPTTGSNNGNFTYNVGVNGDNARTGTITLSATDGSGVPDQPITIVQIGHADSYMILNPSAQSVEPNGGTGYSGIVTSNVEWQISTSESWISNISPVTGSNNGSFTYNIDTNKSYSARSGTITLSATDGSGVEDNILTIIQSGISAIDENYRNNNVIKCYPNPFSHSTTISIDGQINSKYDFYVYNQMGKLIYFKKDNTLSANSNSIVWTGIDNKQNKQNAGVYNYIIKYNEKVYSGKIVLLK